MKGAKLVMGVLCILLGIRIMLTSYDVWRFCKLFELSESDGTVGMLLGATMIGGGIVTVAARANNGKGITLACSVMFLLAGFLGYLTAGIYEDLKAWAFIMWFLSILNLFLIPAAEDEE